MKLCCYGTPFLPAACGMVLQRVELILSAWDVLVLKPENQNVTLNSPNIKKIPKKEREKNLIQLSKNKISKKIPNKIKKKFKKNFKKN